ncbi:MAG: LysM peptidoglycan-binding domain-containing protein [Okeania sp. SIO2D1]|uniref:CIS tube protein n=1 Tax=Okeania sp. SIO2C9 TaxID=2607791 RepID=UPI0013B8A32B|nr:hypothetical protein [Okeania sp. SIO2C9]NEQ75371.1 LysM peptidoglycan-binding domain-containing protein [Okeania sp. SIO2C9]NES68510.1 LysM peptidoglycan-binding domain-containing protein [Okeania sp. SIO2D1]
MIKNTFKLEKLKINVYDTASRSGSPKDTFEVMFNPESYSLKYENVYQTCQGINTSGRMAKYSLSKPEKLSLKLILDNTGVTSLGATSLLSSGDNDVYFRVQNFLQLTTDMDGNIHEPKYLKIEWGDLNFSCRLESVEINYTLFNRSGQPTRAELNTVFVGSIEDSKRVKEENKNSPDVYHSRIVKSGDKLPLMTQTIYGDPAYYIQIAKVNNLNNFRKLKAGTNIKFPPVKEEEQST